MDIPKKQYFLLLLSRVILAKIKYVFLLFSFLFLATILSCKDAKSNIIMTSVLDPEAMGLKQEFTIISERNYEHNMKTLVIPYLNEYKMEGVLQTENNTSLYYEYFALPHSIATVVIFEGFCEWTQKFDEVTYYFLQKGYNVCRFDHRGLGNSSRDYYYDLSRVYIKDFSIYVTDAIELINKIIIPRNINRPLYLYAHSMGGCIGALVLEEYPNVFSKAVLSTPMLKLKLPTVEFFVRFLSWCAVKMGFANSIVPGHKPYNDVWEFDEEKSYDGGKTIRALSYERLKYQAAIKKEHENYHTTAATYAWTLAAIRATHTATSRQKKIAIPVLLFSSQYDERVLNKGQIKLSKNNNVTMVYCKNAEHEIYNSKNEYLLSYYDMMFSFFAN